MNFKLTIDPLDKVSITRTGAAVDLASNVFPTLKAARNALTDMVDSRIRALRRIRDEVIRTPERDLPTDEPPFQTIGQQMAEIGRQVEAGVSGQQQQSTSGPPVAPAQAPLTPDPQAAGEGGGQPAAATDLLAVPDFLKRPAPTKPGEAA